jgi:hypothetical protein
VKVVYVCLRRRLRTGRSELVDTFGDDGKKLGHAKGQTLVFFPVLLDILRCGVMFRWTNKDLGTLRTWASVHIFLTTSVAPSN